MTPSRRRIFSLGAGVAALPLLAGGARAQVIGTTAHVDDFGAVGDGVTDDTLAINAAIDSVRSTGGRVVFSAKPYLITSINATQLTSVEITGEGGGVNGQKGARVLPSTPGLPALDLTGSAGVTVSDLQIGGHENGGPTLGQVGILLAQSQINPGGSTLIKLSNVHIAGEWTAAPLYCYGVGDSMIEFCRLWKFGGGVAAAFVRENWYGITSPHVPIATGIQNVGNWLISMSELHDFSGGGTSGAALALRGCSGLTLQRCLLDSSTTAVGTIYCADVAGTPCWISVYDSTFYTESGVPANYNYFLERGSSLLLRAANNSYANAVAKIKGAVSFVQDEIQ